MDGHRTERSAAERVYFDAVLHPHRSLSARGFALLMVCAGAAMLAVGTGFMLVGAWPVIGFCGLELILLYFAFRLNYRSARAYETVRLSESGLVVQRISPRGRVQAWRFEPGWLRIHMDDPPRRESRLTLASHGRSLVIGAFLTPEERLEVATALRAALDTYRTGPASAG